MVDITITPDRLFIEVLGTHKLWSLKSRLDIPLENVKNAFVDPEPAMGWFQGLKLAGADLPNIFRAGLFLQDGDKVFWDVRHPKKTIVIELEGEGYARLIVEVKKPSDAVRHIKQAISDYQSAKEEAARELAEFVEGPTLPLQVSSEEDPVRQLRTRG
jgi:hypothetical protein